MSFELDQSGKIEDTARATVIDFANDHHGAIKIAAAEKRFLLEVYRLLGKPKMFTLQVFLALTHAFTALNSRQQLFALIRQSEDVLLFS